MAAIGPNGPVELDPGAYDARDLDGKITNALAGDAAGRHERVSIAMKKARIYPGNVPPFPELLIVSATTINHDGTPQVGDPLIGVDPVVENGSVIQRRWWKGSNLVATIATFFPTSTGDYRYEVTVQGLGGQYLNSSATVTVSTPPAELRRTIFNTLRTATLLSKLIEGEPQLYAEIYPLLQQSKARVLALRDDRIATEQRMTALEARIGR